MISAQKLLTLMDFLGEKVSSAACSAALAAFSVFKVVAFIVLVA